MINQNDSVSRFTEVINKIAQDECKKLQKQIDNFSKKELSGIKKEAEADLKSRLEFEKNRISDETNKTISSYEAECKKKIAQKREEITEKVFQKAKDKISAYTKGDAYLSFLKKSIEEIKAELGSDCTFFVKAQDKEKVCALTDCKVCVSGKIQLGGIFAESADGSLMLDDTLDSRLQGKREWFLQEAAKAF